MGSSAAHGSLAGGVVVYHEAGEPISSVVDDKNGEGKEVRVRTSAKSYAQGPPEGSNTELFQVFFDGLAAMEKRYQASKKPGKPH
ncbi:hypothetical protein F5X97DRAFT_287047 [Nemania serpens]|nr:hypothetical protein F5X97DRAFT_287047 [Nemania serpens]